MKQEVKSSLTLIPDESSVMEHLKRSDLQIYIGKQCTEQNMIIPQLDGRGWKEEEGQIIPVWFEALQLPPALTRRAPRNKDGYAADSEK